MNQIKVIGYVRVSTEEQAREGISLFAQQTKVRLYCKLHELDLIDIHVDAGASAKNLNRTALRTALEALESNEAQGLVIVKLDRLTRNISDWQYLIDNYFGEKAKHSSNLLSVNDQIDTRQASGRLVLNILMSVAQWEREAIGERTKTAMAAKKTKGERVSRRIPYGFNLSQDKMHIEPNRYERKTAEMARDFRKGGLSLRKIGLKLSEVGRKPRNGLKWHAETVKMLMLAPTN